MKQSDLFEVEEEGVVLDPVRTARQEEIVRKWKANNGRGTLLAVTGFGKSRTAMMAAKELLSSPNAKVERDVTVIVPSVNLYNEWKERLASYDFPSRVYIINTLVNEFSRERPLNTSLLIPDEFHRYHSDVHGTLFDIVNYNFVFGTTATVDDEDPKFVRMKQIAPIIDTVTLEEAREHDWVSDFTIYNLGIELSSKEDTYYKSLQKQYNKYFKTFDFDYGLAMECLSNDKLRKRHAEDLGWEEGAVMTHAVQLTRIVQKRKSFLYELPLKVELAEKIIRKFSDDIFITFSESNKIADELTRQMPDISVSYHSDLSTLITDKRTKEVIAESVTIDGKTRYKDNTGRAYDWKSIKEAYPKLSLRRKGIKTRRKEALKLFKNKDNLTRAINTAKALDEGANIPQITASIVTSGTSKTRQSIQRLGRSIRKVKGKIAFQVEIYVKNTQDELWLRSRQKELVNIKWIDTINEINT